MQGRICPNCFTRRYSSDSSRVWECEVCGHDIPVLEDEKLIEIKIPNKRRLLKNE
jgi:ribosomal protein L37AE/L43A